MFGEPGNESADRLAGLGANLASEPERDWDVGDLDNAVSSNVAQTSKYVDRASGSSCSTTNTAFSHVEVDADFPFLSDQELEQMARDQSFD
ncbi:hypothetical protein FRB99_005267 [Tulasnella sp. 403]|nr:hypothetical protein FRB99_005267 [Tulasnella sp. 403]